MMFMWWLWFIVGISFAVVSVIGARLCSRGSSTCCALFSGVGSLFMVCHNLVFVIHVPYARLLPYQMNRIFLSGLCGYDADPPAIVCRGYWGLALGKGKCLGGYGGLCGCLLYLHGIRRIRFLPVSSATECAITKTQWQRLWWHSDRYRPCGLRTIRDEFGLAREYYRKSIFIEMNDVEHSGQMIP